MVNGHNIILIYGALDLDIDGVLLLLWRRHGRVHVTYSGVPVNFLILKSSTLRCTLYLQSYCGGKDLVGIKDSFWVDFIFYPAHQI